MKPDKPNPYLPASQPNDMMLIPYLQRRAGRALAEVFRLEQELIRQRMALDHAVMSLKDARARQLRSGKVAK